MTTQPTNPPSDAPDATDLDRLAFDATAAMRAALPLEHAAPYNLVASYAAGKALWIAPRLAPYRARMLALPEYDIQHLDRFETVARALLYVQTEITRRIERAKQLPEIAREGWALRALMMSYAEGLSVKGKFAPELVARLKEGSGYRDLAEDLKVLVSELLVLPPAYTSPESLVTRADTTRAAEIADAVLTAVGNAAAADLTHAALMGERQKLGSLLMASHSQLRRAMTFLRWAEKDVGELVPSLHVTGVPPTAAPAEGVDLEALHQEMHAVTGTTHSDAEDNPFAPQDDESGEK
jgi:hypothetical protein